MNNKIKKKRKKEYNKNEIINGLYIKC